MFFVIDQSLPPYQFPSPSQLVSKMSLLATLSSDISNGPSLQLYALACTLCRLQPPTPPILSCLSTLHKRDGDKWLSPIHNLSLLNLPLVSSLYCTQIPLYRAFLQPLFQHKYQQGLLKIANVLAEEFVRGEPSCSLEVLFTTTTRLMELSREYKMLTLSDVFVRHETVKFMGRVWAMDGGYMGLARCMVERYCELEKEHIYLLTLFDFNQYFEVMVTYMREMLVRCVAHPTDSALLFIGQASQSIYLYYQFNELLPNILQICVAALMEYTVKIKTANMEDIDEAINYEIDLIGAKESETRYTIVAQLIVNLCKGVDGALARILRTTITEVQLLLGHKPTEQALVMQMFAQGVDPVQKVQISYLILCIISNAFGQRTDLLDQIKKFFQLNGKQIFTIHQSHPLLNFRMLKLVQCYCTILLQKQVQQSLVMMLRCIRQQPGTIYSQQASQTFQAVITHKDLYSRIENVIYDLVSLLGVILETTEDVRFLELLCFMFKNYRTLTERYSETFVMKVAIRIQGVARQCSIKMEQGNQLLFKLFQCLSQICKNKDIQQSYIRVQQFLQPLTQLLSDPRRISYQQQLLQIGVLLVKVSTQMNSYVIGCLKYLKLVYEKSQTLTDVYEFIYSCCNYASKMILWEGKQAIRLFVDIVLDYLGKANERNQDGFVEGCYLMEVIVQNFQAYYQDHEEEKREIQRVLLGMGVRREEWRVPMDCLLISLYYIRKFEMPALNCQITSDRRANQLYMLYIGLSLKEYINPEKFLSALAFYQNYLRFKAPKVANISTKMQQQEQVPIQNKVYMDYRRIRLPLVENVDELQIFKKAVLQLQKTGEVNAWELPQKQQQLLRQLPNTTVCGRSIRHLQHFNKIEIQQTKK